MPDQGVNDPRLGERFRIERRARHEVFDDVEAALTALGETSTARCRSSAARAA